MGFDAGGRDLTIRRGGRLTCSIILIPKHILRSLVEDVKRSIVPTIRPRVFALEALLQEWGGFFCVNEGWSSQ